MVIIATPENCKQCGEEYIPAYQSVECPHEMLADKTPREQVETYLMITFGKFFHKTQMTNMYKETDKILGIAEPYYRQMERERIVEWLDGDCEEHPKSIIMKRCNCAKCWQALKEGKDV